MSRANQRAFRRALKFFDGNQSKMAEAIGTTQSRLSYVARMGNPLPPDLVLATEKATGISRHDLRPDIYPREIETVRRDGKAG